MLRRLRPTWPLSVAIVAATLSGIAIAQSSGIDFEIQRETLSSGGSRSFSNQFTVSGTIGQAEASAITATSNQFQINGGFWANGEIPSIDDLVFNNGFEEP